MAKKTFSELSEDNFSNSETPIEIAIVITRKLIKMILFLYLITLLVFASKYYNGPVTFAEAKLGKDIISRVQTFFDSGTNDATWTWESAKEFFSGQLDSMSKEFPSQNSETWFQLQSTIGKTLGAKEPKNPAVITALIPPSLDEHFSKCFLNQIATALNNAVAPMLHKVPAKDRESAVTTPLVISPSDFKQNSITEVRQRIETYLKTKGKFVIVENVDKFKKEAHLLMFHGLCDTYHAVDVRAIILFPLRVPESIFQTYSTTWAQKNGWKIANEVLFNAWRNVVGVNVGPALITRIADAVIVLNEGDTCTEAKDHGNPVIAEYSTESNDQNDAQLNSEGSPESIGVSVVTQCLGNVADNTTDVNKLIENFEKQMKCLATQMESNKLEVGNSLSSIMAQIAEIEVQLEDQKQEIIVFKETVVRYTFIIITSIVISSMVTTCADILTKPNRSDSNTTSNKASKVANPEVTDDEDNPENTIVRNNRKNRASSKGDDVTDNPNIYVDSRGKVYSFKSCSVGVNKVTGKFYNTRSSCSGNDNRRPCVPRRVTRSMSRSFSP